MNLLVSNAFANAVMHLKLAASTLTIAHPTLVALSAPKRAKMALPTIPVGAKMGTQGKTVRQVICF